MASRAWAWLRANAAPLGVGTPVVGVFASYAWNATETHRMAHKIRRGYFQPKAKGYDHRFCLFDRYMMEKASMVGLVGLKSTGKSSTLSHFLREKPNPFYPRQCSGLTKGRPSSEDCAECAVGNGKLSPNFHRNPRPPARQGCEVALC